MWKPSANTDMLRKRAALLRDIREFFFEREVLEVDVPVMGVSTATDPHLKSYLIDFDDAAAASHYLQTSPEFFMKRLLCAGSEAIYYLGKAFRFEESGRHHNPEFTMLEWYQPGWNEVELAQEVLDLIAYVRQCFEKDEVVPEISFRSLSYRSAFEAVFSINPHEAEVDELKAIAHQRLGVRWDDSDKSVWLDLLFSQLVEPSFGDDLILIHDFPVCQSALAQIDNNAESDAIARRFEVYWKGLELANGYFELVDAEEQQQRFLEDLKTRNRLGKEKVNFDSKLIEALESGLPECAGVALGVDRLLMCLAGESDIAKVLPFADSTL